MTRTITITADDFGLTRGITDSILETVDHGPVRRVSLAANGNAVDYALQEYEKRKNHLELVAHLNLTEGKALSFPKEIPHLICDDGRFRHSVGSLWLSYIFATKNTRTKLRTEVQHEARAQLTRITHATGMTEIAVNGHQHVHLVPFIADTLSAMPEVASLRKVNEPAYLAGICSPGHLLIRPIIRHLSYRPAVTAKSANQWFIGFAYAGHMTIDCVRSGLSRIQEGDVEILFHPGSAREGELQGWSGNGGWYVSPDRSREHDELLNPNFDEALHEPYSPTAVSFSRTFRFVVSGGTATMAHLAILYLLTEYAGLWYLSATMVGWCFGFLVSFTLQKFWTFDDARITSVRHQASRYFLLQLSNVFLNIAGMFVLVSLLHVWYMFAQVMVAVVLAVETYFISRHLIFFSHSE